MSFSGVQGRGHLTNLQPFSKEICSEGHWMSAGHPDPSVKFLPSSQQPRARFSRWLPGTMGAKNGIFFIAGMGRQHASLLQSQSTVWSTWIKYFGTGTKLIVSSKRSSAPASSEILQRKHENQLIYVCLIEKFYPDVIRVTWTEEEKEVTDNVVRGDPWQPTKEDQYSVASWLTVPVENEHKNYHCKYEHESQGFSLPTRVKSVEKVPEEESCDTAIDGDVMAQNVTLPDPFMHRTAYLVYIILLLKSSIYYLIILFFIYRVWASSGPRGKKA